MEPSVFYWSCAPAGTNCVGSWHCITKARLQQHKEIEQRIQQWNKLSPQEQANYPDPKEFVYKDIEMQVRQADSWRLAAMVLPVCQAGAVAATSGSLCHGSCLAQACIWMPDQWLAVCQALQWL